MANKKANKIKPLVAGATLSDDQTREKIGRAVKTMREQVTQTLHEVHMNAVNKTGKKLKKEKVGLK